MDIGVGKGFQIGGQLSLSPGPDFDNNEFFKDSYSPFSITNAFRGYVPDVFVLGLCAQRPCIHQYIFSG
ncbi:MAG: hypothetical protein PHG34_08280 [Candidatus Cloacimonetes bacterium]|nr:hypothetical protein [Candidatus Cloacimonadota bacterium]